MQAVVQIQGAIDKGIIENYRKLQGVKVKVPVSYLSLQNLRILINFDAGCCSDTGCHRQSYQRKL